MTDHTPGPWDIDQDYRPDMAWNNHIIDRHGNRICFMAHDGTRENETGQANARLIAAAPDLLAALKRIEHDWDGEPEDMQEAREAINRAEGKP